MKMLCIDGGGIRGIFAIEILHAIEREYGQPVSELFDVIAGTSTGAIIAASVSLQIKMSDVLERYKVFSEKIFKRQATVGLFKSVYSDKYLRRFIQKAFGDLLLSEIKKPLLIPAVDITHGKPFIHRSLDENSTPIKLWDAVLSSCSAPVYFPPNNINNNYLAIDGGLWANNPSLVCVTEALSHFKKEVHEIQILSIGTGQQNIDFMIEKEKEWGAEKWLPFRFPSLKMKPKLLDLAIDLFSESVTYHCQHLLGDHYVRINGKLGEHVPFDDIHSINKLSLLGKKIYDEQKEMIDRFIKNEHEMT
ncbi:CBASS cGAMP-activated phospholipase [Fredinandcohnia quinoae]|uniref:Patatin-like phospholipase family protein n=1 Tax=Fredinandcohnia quinoae TaxID=2918902 RepID=A0AAW5E4H6_9BACI|nr:CBASS cGAMP-activated phospholipase [Fredinandcohnia sp. SECRCQ15]MCH1625714.1 patatin-like phospholipase family protein [Fredinandcohnia sp. SECRCQ15]